MLSMRELCTDDAALPFSTPATFAHWRSDTPPPRGRIQHDGDPAADR